MEEFNVIQPSSLLAPYIKNYWFLKTVSNTPTWVRTVPTGMMSLIFHRGNRLFSIHENELHPRTFLSGHDKAFADLKYRGQIRMISVVFYPAGVRAFFNLPIIKTYNQRLTAGDLGDKEWSILESSLTSTEDDPMCVLLIEQFLLKRLTRLGKCNWNRVEAAIRLINSGQTDVAVLADAACLSQKQFNRIFSEYVGSNPKAFARTIRFQKALHLLQTQPQISFTALTYECGYFDQSHLIKDFKALSGYTPTEYMAICRPHSDYFS